MSDVQRNGVRKALKEMIEALHRGLSPEEVKSRFREVLKSVSAEEIARLEEELVREGMPREKLRKLCQIHLELFREALQDKKMELPEGHPLVILMQEHRQIEGWARRLQELSKEIASGAPAGEQEGRSVEMKELVHLLGEAESHYIREENVLFPYLEKHGLNEPPAIMWMEHDEIRTLKKEVRHSLERLGEETTAGEALNRSSARLLDNIEQHFEKEERILFQAALAVVPGAEWGLVRSEFDGLGYGPFDIPPPFAGGESIPEQQDQARVDLTSGTLSPDELKAIFDTLPFDVTFVDREDRVRYFNESEGRIFPRTKAILGRKVQRCHPQKSVHIVEKILQEFRQGKRKVAEFWIKHNGRLVYIRYFPVRDRAGKYLGCLEVTQDITELKKIEGEKRLLDPGPA